jgi:Predicted membrane protein (DUF2339)
VSVHSGSDDEQQQRIERLENAVRTLFAEMSALREELRGAATRPAPPRPAPPYPMAPRRPAPRVVAEPPETMTIEAMVGRYGTLALATITILLGVGAFVGWAITHHLLTPWMRVGLGGLFAVGLAALGENLRRRDSVRFGNVLLSLALAVVHVDAWGAGPRLHLIPNIAALAIAAAASTALSIFAQTTEDEPVFAVGVGGALLAPFVTMAGTPNVLGLLAYGYAVTAFALVALRDTDWYVAARLLTLGASCYAVVAVAAALPADPATIKLAPVAFALAVASTALVLAPGRDCALVTQFSLGVAAIALAFRIGDTQVPLPAVVILAALGTAIAYGSLWSIDHEAEPVDVRVVFGVGILPLVFLSAAIFTTSNQLYRAAFALLWLVGALVTSSLDADRRQQHWAVAATACWLGIVSTIADHDATVAAVGLALVAAVSTLVLRDARAKAMTIPALLALVTGAVLAFDRLEARPAYGYLPFLTPASGAALLVSAVWIWFSWVGSRLLSKEPNPMLRLSGVAVAFAWVRVELARVGSPQLAVFLLIAFYAATGVTAVFVGRARALPLLRHVGLGLAIYAALKTVVEASSMEIALRIGSYFLAGLFLISVAYWYRDANQKSRLAPTER